MDPTEPSATTYPDSLRTLVGAGDASTGWMSRNG